jgi:site-specific recombinase XerD
MNSSPIARKLTVDLPRRKAGSSAVALKGPKKTRYLRDLKHLARFLWEKGRTLTHATEKDVAAWVRGLKKRDRFRKHPRAGSTALRRILAAHGFFEQVKGRTSRNPFARFNLRRSGRRMDPPISLGDKELKRLIDALNPDSPWGLRNRAILLLRFGTPLSLSEICRLKRTEVILRGRKSEIRLARKGGVVQRIPLRGQVLNGLRKHLRQNGRKGRYLFQAIPGSLKALSRSLGPARPSRPLSSGWVSSMLVKAQGAAHARKAVRSRRSKVRARPPRVR